MRAFNKRWFFNGILLSRMEEEYAARDHRHDESEFRSATVSV